MRSSKQGDPFYKSPAWESLREQALKRDGYRCQHCMAKCLGKKHNKPSPHVDHIISRRVNPRLALSLSNLQTLCHSCHSKRTKADQLDRPEIGLDGFLVE